MPLLSDEEYKGYMKYKKDYNYNQTSNISYGSGKFKRIIQRISVHQVVGLLIFLIALLLFLDALGREDVTTPEATVYLILMVTASFYILL